MGEGKRRQHSDGPNGNGHVNGSRQSSSEAHRSRRATGSCESDVPQEPVAGGPIPRSVLSAGDVERYRRALLAKRAELIGAVSQMENEALGKSRSESAGDLSQMPIHMADIGTDNYEQEFTLGLVANERETLKLIDRALERIENGTYGICLGTHKPISKARLDARPWAEYCIEYRRSQERNGRIA